MKKSSLLILSTLVAISAWFGSAAATQARPPYKAQWDEMYLKQVPAAAEAKCGICHVGKDKKDRNAYGKELAKLLTKDDVKNVDKIKKALGDVEKMHSKADDPKSPTFGELIKSGKLPGG